MARLTPNEVNNLVLLLIKHGYEHLIPELEVPPIALTKQVLLETVDHGTSIPEIIACTMFVMEARKHVVFSKTDFERLRAHLHRVAVAFMKQPEEVRSGIGVEPDAFATRH